MSGVKRFTLLGLIGVLLVTSAVWFIVRQRLSRPSSFRKPAPEGTQAFERNALEDVVFQVIWGRAR